ncbi:MAG: TIGR00153 family protein [Thermoplasmatota archaeon]
MEKDPIMENIRAPIIKTIYKSPFEGLKCHSHKLDECVGYMGKCVNAYLNCRFDEAERYKKMVSKAEHEADMIKSNIRGHIPKSIFMQVQRSQFHMLLHDSDSILDYAEDVAVLLNMKRTRVPKDIADDISSLTQKVLECVRSYQKVMDALEKLLEVNFKGKRRDQVKDHIKDIHRLEHEADIIEYDISSKLFNLENSTLDPISVVHLLKVIDRLGTVADKAENGGDRVRAMMSK